MKIYINLSDAKAEANEDFVSIYPYDDWCDGLILSRTDIISIAKEMKIKPEEIKPYKITESPYDLTANKKLRQKFLKNK